MIRRTLINRARRQRDLARTLIARHSMMAYDRSQPQLGYRPTASSDESSALASAAEPAALALYEIAPSADELADPFAAWPESPAIGAPTLFDPAPLAAPAPTLRAMTEEPAHAVPDATEPVSASAQPAAAPDQRPGNTLADLVRRMREPGWIPPEAAPATKPQALAPAEPTANEQIADLVRRMQKPPQRTTPKAERPRIPLGQRMSEAADFGQTPASPHEDRPAAVPSPDDQPAPYRELSAETADVQPAPVFSAAAYSAAEVAADAADSTIALTAVPTTGGELRPIVVRSDGEPVAITRNPGAVNADTTRIALPVPSSTLALDGAEASILLAPAAPGSSNAWPETAAAPDAPAADRPPAWTGTHAPSTSVDDLRNAPQEQFQSPTQKDAGSTPALPLSVPSDLPAPADIQPASAGDARRPASCGRFAAADRAAAGAAYTCPHAICRASANDCRTCDHTASGYI